MKDNYTKAIVELILSGKNPDLVFQGVRTAMQRRGHEKLFSSVVRNVFRRISYQFLLSAPQLTLAKEDDKDKYSNLIKDSYIKIDKSIIGGYIYRDSGRQEDASYKRKLLNWYKSAITSN